MALSNATSLRQKNGSAPHLLRGSLLEMARAAETRALAALSDGAWKKTAATNVQWLSLIRLRYLGLVQMRYRTDGKHYCEWRITDLGRKALAGEPESGAKC
jgi:hypothetical protein